MSFRAAVLCSTAIHVGFLALRPPAGLVPLRQTLYPLEVSYVILERARPGRAAASELRQPPSQPGPESRSAEPRKPAPPEPSPVQREEPAKRQESVKPQDSARRVPDPDPTPVAPREVPGRAAGVLGQAHSGAAVLPGGEFAAIRHKELVREHLRQRLRYPEVWLQGTVRLKVTILRDGTLKDAAVLESSDPRLTAVALKDTRSAGPYPRFSKEMKPSEAEYEFLVQYRPDGSSL